MLEKSLGMELNKALDYFVRAYVYLAHLANKNGTAHFALYPKLHSLHEISHMLKRQSELADFVINPACHSCSLDEDFIGRTACISRTVSPRIIAKRTLERYLVHIQSAWTWFGDGQEGEWKVWNSGSKGWMALPWIYLNYIPCIMHIYHAMHIPCKYHIQNARTQGI